MHELLRDRHQTHHRRVAESFLELVRLFSFIADIVTAVRAGC